jgi:hypothetical protein
MNTTPGEPPKARRAAMQPGSPGGSLDLERGMPVCRFLRSRDGAWSSVHASRDLRCWAVAPQGQPAVQKQRQLCTAAAHGSCAAYVAAMAAEAGPDPDLEGPALWPDVAPAPVAIDSVHTHAGGGVGWPRPGGQALLVGLMAFALLVLVFSRANPLAGPAASRSPAASAGLASAIAGASAAASGPPAPTVAITPSPPSPTPTPAPARTTSPTASQRTYTVRSGDTIAGIAARYHSTVKAIVAANNIVDPRTIHPGQVLVIP